jgi:signal transduction histidine kinase
MLNHDRRPRSGQRPLQALRERSADGIMLIDSSHQICLANPAIHHLLQRDPARASLIGLDLRQFIAPVALPIYEQLLQRAYSDTERSVCAEIIFCLTGEQIPAECVVNRRIADHPPGHMQLLVRDLREHRHSELLLDIERRRMAYDLHDSLAQVAAGAYQQLQAFAADYRSQSPERMDKLTQALSMAGQVVAETRRMINRLHPALLEESGFMAALHLQVEALRAEGWSVELSARFAERPSTSVLPALVERSLYWICQEAVTNIRKHAQSRQVSIGVVHDEDQLTLTIRDDGRGFDPALLARESPHDRRLGLLSMQERAAWLGGWTVIESAPGSGTTVIVTIPLDRTTRELRQP